jgi:guanylate kinase
MGRSLQRQFLRNLKKRKTASGPKEKCNFDIDVAGGLRIKSKFPDETLAVFVKPPSIDELKNCLKKRSTESEDKINMRIAKASVELQLHHNLM